MIYRVAAILVLTLVGHGLLMPGPVTSMPLPGDTSIQPTAVRSGPYLACPDDATPCGTAPAIDRSSPANEGLVNRPSTLSNVNVEDNFLYDNDPGVAYHPKPISRAVFQVYLI